MSISRPVASERGNFQGIPRPASGTRNDAEKNLNSCALKNLRQNAEGFKIKNKFPKHLPI
ncbi:hypothetical protein A2Y83_01445 [Candidatus Falkowbacteria bacterium RBG_13_39_14]|uniref:Uncharacterized protein n=1 Tax=Candidatus Falkowbacteria bacterium RBG_13_39_14 TaxID=1797985 RepID=A0A1F5S6E8_9BACT|nr:MAG: hypothetical protein A2Y83_01445 [Candidatus Falkowbacteria bacterium RBG_13_39_14]